MEEELYQQFKEKSEQHKKEIADKWGENVKDFISVYRNFKIEHYNRYSKAMEKHLYDKPSAFFKSEYHFIYEIVPQRFHKHLDYTVDNCINCIFSKSYYRRSFHSTDYSYYSEYVFSEIYYIIKYAVVDASLDDIFNNRLNETELAYKKLSSSGLYTSTMIACELDSNNKDFEQTIENVLLGEAETVLSRTIIEGIIKSNNANAHNVLCKLLLATRLQEGLRQVICECADSGTKQAFTSIIRTIYENNLLRFSSVKRAVGTWLGLISYDTKDIDRISQKSLELILACIDNIEKREEYLNTEDSMKIYISLWAYGVDDVSSAVNRTIQLIKNGTKHQVLTGGYFMANLEIADLKHKVTKYVIKKFPTEYDVLAVYMPYFVPNWCIRNWTEDRKLLYSFESYTNYFDSIQEVGEYYNILCDIYNAIPKKSLVYSPCIFPWYSAELTKSIIAEYICVMAGFSGDNSKKDFASKLINDVVISKLYYSSSREMCVSLLLSNAETEVQLKVLTEALGNKDSATRNVAFDIIQKGSVKLTEENYLQIEGMLRYKAEDIRSKLMSLLYERSDEQLEGSVKRLLADKKEEKRTAGLDLVMRMEKDENKRLLYDKCKVYVCSIKDPTTKEKILIDNIVGGSKNTESLEEQLYDESDLYNPDLPNDDYIKLCFDMFKRYFPDTKIHLCLSEESKSLVNKVKDTLSVSEMCESCEQAYKDCQSLSDFIELHKDDEILNYSGETVTLENATPWFLRYNNNIDGHSHKVQLMELWEQWYSDNSITPERLFRMSIFTKATLPSKDAKIREVTKDIDIIFGKGFSVFKSISFRNKIDVILQSLITEHTENIKEITTKIFIAFNVWYIKEVADNRVFFRLDNDAKEIEKQYQHYIAQSQISAINQISSYVSSEGFKSAFPIIFLAYEKTFTESNKLALDRQLYYRDLIYGTSNGHHHSYNLNVIDYIRALYNGMITQRQLYKFIFDENNLDNSIEMLSNLVIFIKDREKNITSRGWRGRWRVNRSYTLAEALTGKKDNFTDDDNKLFDLALSVYNTVMNVILSLELKRGDTETKFSKYVKNINRVYGLECFISILSALGKSTLERSSYYYGENVSKKRCLGHLLSVCIPDNDDNVKTLGDLLKGTDITEKRLIEASMYSPEWLEMVAEYLGWNGFVSACYYFMAHINESFDDKRKAIISRYTPLTEEQLNAGAFDISWFKEAYQTIGEKRFKMIYDSAKYISDGTKHSRARKYADCVLGKYSVDELETTISDKRNKDFVMGYPLIPIKNEDDTLRRYLFLQKFLKESKQFGSQRMASEKKAVEIAIQNLATNNGYSDVTRLTLKMEAKLVESKQHLFNQTQVDEVSVWLNVDELGKTTIMCEKNGKKLKSVPAKLKKNEHIVILNEAKKQFTEQYRRTKLMLENAMEEKTEFSAEEIYVMLSNRVTKPIVEALVFVCGENIGFIKESHLINASGEAVELSPKDSLRVAHSYDLYTNKSWSAYQQLVFENHIVQPFKQIFRELYIKTEEESQMTHSLRYAGNQIQPRKTLACLKNRRWIADIEDGLQKVYYKENIVASIYAMADWFSPAEIEAPTLEWVVFYDRKTWKQLKISEIPDIIFSEVMRDVDLAVSVAHAGGIDPEASHSTIEMRSALLEFTLPLFKITNVNIKGTHAHINGKYGNYTIHLGSGVIHKEGGSMIVVLPVHSQHRGKLFLPFADDDPKTAEVITKIIMLAQDKKLKDPTILSQIQ